MSHDRLIASPESRIPSALFASVALRATFAASIIACDILIHSPLSTARPSIISRFPASASATALFPTASHSASLRGNLSSIPAAVTVVLTDSNTTVAAGPTMPFMICLTVATGAATALLGGAARRARSAPRQ